MFYTITDYYDPIGEKKIPTKCPDCGNNNCLELSFYQRRTESPFGTKTTKKVTGILFCHHSKTEIAPVLWTDEIANYFDTEKPKLRLQPNMFKFSKRFYILLFFLLTITAVVVGFGVKEYITATDIENISKGDKVKAMYSGIEKSNSVMYGDTWFLVQRIEADTVWLQRHKDHNNEKGFSFDLETSNFSGELIKASLPRIKKRSLESFDYENQPFTGIITEIETD
ncbi:hypothetical protein [Costertonia aggregata]|uniref:Uncharacterized protein n=1 Tax=Costertonia aggregata TaxID=343403 RepID=A0A7H9ASM0_9FLAO|nr:hypothetical protein [Costertonia aggregata]QLG46440.1 hypothetical protein HYG79_14145 [Costertonia aggregata]